MKSKELTMAVVATLIMVGMMTPSVASYTDNGNDATMKIVPSSIDRTVGDEFSVEIVIDPDGVEVYSGQYALRFDPEILEALSQEEGDFRTRQGR